VKGSEVEPEIGGVKEGRNETEKGVKLKGSEVEAKMGVKVG
jgi:hypothetical protein